MIRVLLLLSCFWAIQSHAELKCEVDLNFGLVVNDTQIRVINESHTVYQINHANQLIVRGEWLTLGEEQQLQLSEYAKGLHYVVPKMILLATEGVDLAVGTVEHVYVGLVGQEHKSYDKLQSSLQRVQRRIKEKFIHAGNNFYMGPGRLENVDDLVYRELEEQIEAAINTSLGGVLSAIGGLTSGGDEVTEQQIQDLSKRIETIEVEIEQTVAPKAASLRKKAEWFCNKMHQLNKIENQLRQSIPELSEYNVIMTEDDYVSKKH
jgi:hypothetical protein